jgi:hypothetical protein
VNIPDSLFCPTQISPNPQNNNGFDVLLDCGINQARVISLAYSSESNLQILSNIALQNPVMQNSAKQGALELCSSAQEFIALNTEQKFVYGRESSGSNPNSLFNLNTDKFGVSQPEKSICLGQLGVVVVLGKSGNDTNGIVYFGNGASNVGNAVFKAFSLTGCSDLGSVSAYGNQNQEIFMSYVDSKGKANTFKTWLDGPKVWLNTSNALQNKKEWQFSSMNLTLSNGAKQQQYEFKTGLNVSIANRTITAKAAQNTVVEGGVFNLDTLANMTGDVFDFKLSTDNGKEIPEGFSMTPRASLEKSTSTNSTTYSQPLVQGLSNDMYLSISNEKSSMNLYSFDEKESKLQSSLNTQGTCSMLSASSFAAESWFAASYCSTGMFNTVNFVSIQNKKIDQSSLKNVNNFDQISKLATATYSNMVGLMAVSRVQQRDLFIWSWDFSQKSVVLSSSIDSSCKTAFELVALGDKSVALLTVEQGKLQARMITDNGIGEAQTIHSFEENSETARNLECQKVDNTVNCGMSYFSNRLSTMSMTYDQSSSSFSNLTIWMTTDGYLNYIPTTMNLQQNLLAVKFQNYDQNRTHLNNSILGFYDLNSPYLTWGHNPTQALNTSKALLFDFFPFQNTTSNFTELGYLVSSQSDSDLQKLIFTNLTVNIAEKAQLTFKREVTLNSSNPDGSQSTVYMMSFFFPGFDPDHKPDSTWLWYCIAGGFGMILIGFLFFLCLSAARRKRLEKGADGLEDDYEAFVCKDLMSGTAQLTA